MPLIAEDRLGIQALMARYARGVDVECTEEEFLQLFTNDAVMTSPVTGSNVGVEGLKAFREVFMKRRGKLQLRHHINNFVIEGDGDQATLRAYFVIFQTRTDIPPNERETQLRFSGDLDCVLRRVDGHWKIARRDVHIDCRSL